MKYGRLSRLIRLRAGSATVVGAVVLSYACSDVAAPSGGASQAGTGSAPIAGAAGAGAGGAGSGAAGGGQVAGSAGALQSAGSGGQGGGITGIGGSSGCSPACSGTTPVCDETSATCKTCTSEAGCSSDKPLCDTAGAAGLGQCKAIELLAFYTPDIADLAHRSFAADASSWFPSVAQENGFTYEATADWGRLASVTAAPGRIIMFLDNRPWDSAQQVNFEKYMDSGGAFIGYHVCAFSESAADWSWYFSELLGTNSFVKNTWRPTPAQLRVEDAAHPVLQGLDSVFTSAPNEWYAFSGELENNPEIDILLSIDPASFPLGTNEGETWNSGYYPVVWSNTKYKMLYVNMGHNDMDYGGTNEALSFTFSSPQQNKMLLNGIRWLAGVTPSL